MTWGATRSPEIRAEVTRLWNEEGLRPPAIAERTGLTVGQVHGLRMRLALHSTRRDNRPPSDLSPAVLARIGAHTIFPKSVKSPDRGVPILKSGRDNPKLGDVVTKGAWGGMPIYSLTLEERATCPSDCGLWARCYGNAMPFAARNAAGPMLEAVVSREIHELRRRHLRGFVVRLHQLGDFYSPGYVEMWRRLLTAVPQLHVFGYTHWKPGTDIGDAIAEMVRHHGWERCAIRLSHTEAGRGRAVTIPSAKSYVPQRVIVCPAQTGATRSCSTCALCWSPAARSKTVAFIEHGMQGGRR